MGRVEDKVAIVTGAARGTGEATARLLAREGARVVVADILEERGSWSRRRSAARRVFERLDVTLGGRLARAWSPRPDAREGRVDVLVNNAAVLHMAAIEDTGARRLRARGAREPGRHVPRHQGGGAGDERAGRGSIVNVASIDGMSAKNGIVAYAREQVGGARHDARGRARARASGHPRQRGLPRGGQRRDDAPVHPAGVDVRARGARSSSGSSRRREALARREDRRRRRT
jgi:hypothetical protein